MIVDFNERETEKKTEVECCEAKSESGEGKGDKMKKGYEGCENEGGKEKKKGEGTKGAGRRCGT